MSIGTKKSLWTEGLLKLSNAKLKFVPESDAQLDIPNTLIINGLSVSI